MLDYKKKQSTIHLHVIPVMKCGCVFWEFAKRKLATRKDKIKDNKDEKRWLCNLLAARVVSQSAFRRRVSATKLFKPPLELLIEPVIQ
jgi:hypothetical protein